MDAPGHRDFIGNMITGAAQANCGILVIDSMVGGFERSWDAGTQATCKEHAILARSMGVTQMIVAINKLEMTDWSQERFDFCKGVLKPYLTSIGFKANDLFWIPVSGLTGENLIDRSQNKKLTYWYSGQCVVEVLDSMRLPQRNFVKPARVTVMEYAPKSSGSLIGDCIQAKVEAGAIDEKDKLMLMP
jgi:elongation factor 1 alpha-like protein